MIMSYLTKLEMSCFRDAKLPFLKGGHNGREGHYHAKPERPIFYICALKKHDLKNKNPVFKPTYEKSNSK